MNTELIELQTLDASDDRVWCVAWNPTGTLYDTIRLFIPIKSLSSLYF